MIEFNNVYKAYKDKSVLKNVSIKIETGEFFVLIGSSGCGKTTMLKMINKLNKCDSGEVTVNGVNVTDITASDLPKTIGYVVQEGGLFPHLTIAENIALTMKISGEKKENIQPRVDEMLEMVHLDPAEYGGLYPSQLSGGQRQRVGVARAFATDPDIILMDEPFSALDPVTRGELQDEVYRLQKKFHKTIVFVTHDMDEAIKLATRVCIIQNGRVLQCDIPEEILKHPANFYIEEFIGKNKLWNNPEFVKASDIMLSKPVRISRERTVMQAIQIMRHYRIDSLLVTREKQLLGLVWLKDLVDTANYKEPVEAYLSDDYITVFDDTSLQKIITTIDYNLSGIIPVINHDNEILGYLTKGSLLSTLSRRFAPDGSAAERSGIIA